MENIKKFGKGWVVFILIGVGAGIFVGVVGYFIVSQLVSYQNKSAPVLPYDTVLDTEAGSLKLKWGEKIEVASGGGFRGPWRMNESEFHYVDDPTVALSDKGFVGVAWVDQSRKDIFFQIYEPDGKSRFSEPVNVSKNPRTFSWLPRIVFASDDANLVHILWQEIIFSGGSHGGEILFAHSIDAGRTFSAPVNLSNTTAGAGKGRLTRDRWDNGSLDLAMGPEGNIYVAWTEYEGALRLVRSIDAGMSFSAPIYIAGGGTEAPARAPSLAIDAEGVVYLVWTETDNRIGNIHFTKSVDKGRTFSKPKSLFKSSGHADAPKIAVNSKGVIHLVYAKSPEGLFGPYHIRHNKSYDGGQVFEKSKKISRGMDRKKFVSESFPMLDIGGDDRLYVIWEIFPAHTRNSHGLGFTFSINGGQSFAPTSVIPNSADPTLGVNGSQQGLLMSKLDANGAGTIAVVNSTFLINEGSYIWLYIKEAMTRKL